jgi:hypothetical protein
MVVVMVVVVVVVVVCVCVRRMMWLGFKQTTFTTVSIS